MIMFKYNARAESTHESLQNKKPRICRFNDTAIKMIQLQMLLRTSLVILTKLTTAYSELGLVLEDRKKNGTVFKSCNPRNVSLWLPY